VLHLEPLLIIYMAVAIIYIGFFGLILSRKSGIPHILFLVVFGVALGPILHLIEYKVLVSAIPAVSAITIATVTFYSGMNINVETLKAHGGRALILAITGFTLNTIGCGLFLQLYCNFPPPLAYMMGAAFGGTCAAIVVALSSSGSLPIRKSTITAMTLDSTITDVLCIVIASVFLNSMLLGELPINEALSKIAAQFSTGILAGLIIGIIWIKIMHILGQEKYTYMLTFATLLLTYATTEVIGGSGGVASLVFGLTLGNYKSIASTLKMQVDKGILEVLRVEVFHLHSEISFLVEAFFFTYLGLIYTIGSAFEILVAAAITMIVLINRTLASFVATSMSEMAEDRSVISVTIGKGLAAAVMGSMPAQYSLPLSDLAIKITLNVILLTNIIMVLLLAVITKFVKRPKAKAATKEATEASRTDTSKES